MERPPIPSPSPAFLPVGAVVGPWRVVAWAGLGVHGAVYRAVRVGQEHAEPVALKIALLPRHPRFAREAVLLSRSHHPCIPRLIDSGLWKHPCGTLHPYIAMQWIDGLPLYDWAREHPPSSRQVLVLLAQLARALEALHAQGSLHRDFKGDNILVRRSDGRPFLIDFGSGIYPGAPSLTPQILPPGTPVYLSPEAWLFELRFSREPSARYLAGPTDDLYALGVTACRLMTGEYPELAEPRQDEAGLWQLDAVIPPAALLFGSGVEPTLRAWILRLLSVHPAARGTARELAEALERAAALIPAAATAGAGPEAQVREERAGTTVRSAPSRPRAHSGRSWLTAAAAVLAVAVALQRSAPDSLGSESVSQVDAPGLEQPDAGTAGLGDSATAASSEEASKLPAPEVMAEETPPEPQPGQARPDAKGRCPRKPQVALNGGCWLVPPFAGEDCAVLGGQMFKGTCYVPFIPPPGRRPTSSPVDKP